MADRCKKGPVGQWSRPSYKLFHIFLLLQQFLFIKLCLRSFIITIGLASVEKPFSKTQIVETERDWTGKCEHASQGSAPSRRWNDSRTCFMVFWFRRTSIVHCWDLHIIILVIYICYCFTNMPCTWRNWFAMNPGSTITRFEGISYPPLILDQYLQFSFYSALRVQWFYFIKLYNKIHFITLNPWHTWRAEKRLELLLPLFPYSFLHLFLSELVCDESRKYKITRLEGISYPYVILDQSPHFLFYSIFIQFMVLCIVSCGKIME